MLAIREQEGTLPVAGGTLTDGSESFTVERLQLAVVSAAAADAGPLLTGRSPAGTGGSP